MNTILPLGDSIQSVRIEGPDAAYRPARWVPGIDDQVRRTCRDNCNNGWLRKLEDDAYESLKALVRGQEVRLTPDH
jgi:hypothetical protein